MADGNSVGELAKLLSQSRIVLSSDITSDLVNDIDTDLLASKLIEIHRDSPTLSIIDSEEIKRILEEMKIQKAPLPIEVIRSSDFKPEAADIDARYSINNRAIERAEGTTMDFVNYFKDRLRKTRALIGTHNSNTNNMLLNLESLRNYANGRELTIVGVVTNKITTKKGNIMVVIEDETGDARVIFMNGGSQDSRDLFTKSASIINDEVIAIKGKLSNGFVMANDIIWPDIPIRDRKKVEDDIAIAFMSDIHVGSKRFMEKNFYRMIQWLNGNIDSNKDIAKKIKYIIMAGDVADGIGVYPGQDQDLAILDIYAQYRELFNFIDAIPDYIHVFVMPGNHDAVQRAEPQPPLGSDLLKDFKKDNVHIVSNPSMITAHGLDILSYHGTSLDSIISAIPSMSYAQPEKAMIELLKRRHLSPIYGGNIVVPSKDDNLVIDKVPDILHMGHIHKNGVSAYHGVEIVNSGTWQARTDFQIRQGHIPTPCILPVYEMKAHNFTSINFAGDTT